MEMHQEWQNQVRLLVLKWRRMHFLSDKDRKRLLLFLSQIDVYKRQPTCSHPIRITHNWFVTIFSCSVLVMAVDTKSWAYRNILQVWIT